jgi:formamidase
MVCLFGQGAVALVIFARWARDCPYTYMQDLLAGSCHLPGENQVRVAGGASRGCAPPTRLFQGAGDG